MYFHVVLGMFARVALGQIVQANVGCIEIPTLWPMRACTPRNLQCDPCSFSLRKCRSQIATSCKLAVGRETSCYFKKCWLTMVDLVANMISHLSGAWCYTTTIFHAEGFESTTKKLSKAVSLFLERSIAGKVAAAGRGAGSW